MNQPLNVGGQAVLEGVMMRSPNCLAVAVRRPDSEIVVKEAIWHSIWNRFPFLRWPFFRGTVVMIEAMINGMQALDFSARESMPEESSSSESSDVKDDRFQMVLPILFSVVIAILLFKFVPHMTATYSGVLLSGHEWTLNDIAYHVVDGLVKVLLFIGYVAAISYLPDIRRVFMYHGAEHKAIYVHESGEELTVENAKQKSRIHPRCGTSFIMVVILTFIVVSALLLPFLPEGMKPGAGKPFYLHFGVVLLKLPLLIPVAGISYEFNRFAGRNCSLRILRPFLWPGMMMQNLTTREPTDDQLEIALVALRTALRREEGGEMLPEAESLRVFHDFQSFLDTSKQLKTA